MSDDPERRLEQVFRYALNLDPSVELATLRRGEVEEWDSLGHVMLMAGVESEFDVTIELEEALELHTFDEVHDLLLQKTKKAKAS